LDAPPLIFACYFESFRQNKRTAQSAARRNDFSEWGIGLSSYSDKLADETAHEVVQEQKYVSMLFDHVDRLRTRAAERLSAARLTSGGTHQARSERDSMATMYTDQLVQFDAVENGLCFGRLDFTDGGTQYIGRIGLTEETGEETGAAEETDHAGNRQILMDWRAPASRAFYLATAAAPDGVRRRRHIRTDQRVVTGIDDEVLDLDEAARAGRGAHEGLTGEATLLAAVTAGRTGRMSDIVETIQAEQDRVIRADMDGVLVVQGGPGTGKTAVALHRAAYLLYTYRELLSTRAVLIVGPNDTFLRYISQVLPSLAETGVLLCTLGDLYPGITARRAEPDRVAEIKGRAVMADVLAAAVADRQRRPDEPIEVNVDRDRLRLDPADAAEARDRARASGRPHNQARPVFEAALVDALTRQVAARVGADPLGGENLLPEADLAEIRRDLGKEPEVLAVCDWLWPVLTPQQVVAGLFASPARLSAAAPQLTAAERDLLRREPRGGFTPADVPLLDEAAELLGDEDAEATAAALAERQYQERMAYAQGALDILTGSRPHELDDEEAEFLMATDVLDAGLLGERQREHGYLSAAERAAADRRWAFGHIIVDEAQELSPMAWRLLMRRSPSRSMTVVGDVAQTGDLAGTSSWAGVLEPYVDDRWLRAELTVNYRTPAEVMGLAAGVLTRIDPALAPPRSVRATGVPPWHHWSAPGELAGHLADAVRREAADVGVAGEGRLGVIVPAGRIDECAAAVRTAVPGAAVGAQPDLTNPVVVLTVRQAKGLEFDTVLVVDPAGVVAESPRGLNDLYVALTRATQRLGLLHVAGTADPTRAAL
jgi:DNA helicase IV